MSTTKALLAIHMLAVWLPSPAHEVLIALAAVWLYVEAADWIRWGRGR